MLVIPIFSIVALTATALADGADIFDAINNINRQVTWLGNTISGWGGDQADAWNIEAQANIFFESIEDGSKTANQSAAVSDKEAVNIASATLNLAIQVNRTLVAIIAAKPKCDNAGISPFVIYDLGEEKKAAANFSSLVVAKVPVTRHDAIKGSFQNIDDGFNKAIDVYSKS